MYINNNNNNNNNYCQKCPGNTFLSDFIKQFSKINLFYEKKAVVHATTLMHCKDR